MAAFQPASTAASALLVNWTETHPVGSTTVCRIDSPPALCHTPLYARAARVAKSTTVASSICRKTEALPALRYGGKGTDSPAATEFPRPMKPSPRAGMI